MNRLSAISAVIMLAAGTAALAQSPPSETTPPPGTPSSQYPDSTAQPPSTQDMPKDSSTSSTKSATRAQMKDCIAEQKANNPSMSKRDIKKYCESQLNSTPQRQ